LAIYKEADDNKNDDNKINNLNSSEKQK